MSVGSSQWHVRRDEGPPHSSPHCQRLWPSSPGRWLSGLFGTNTNGEEMVTVSWNWILNIMVMRQSCDTTNNHVTNHQPRFSKILTSQSYKYILKRRNRPGLGWIRLDIVVRTHPFSRCPYCSLPLSIEVHLKTN